PGRHPRFPRAYGAPIRSSGHPRHARLVCFLSQGGRTGLCGVAVRDPPARNDPGNPLHRAFRVSTGGAGAAAGRAEPTHGRADRHVPPYRSVLAHAQRRAPGREGRDAGRRLLVPARRDGARRTVASVSMHCIAVVAALLAAQGGRISYESFALPNGLRVLYSEDHSTPVVTVDLWY